MSLQPPPRVPANVDAARARIAQVQARVAAAGVAMRPPPPEPTTCCGRGCNGCVWEGFYEALQYWLDEAQLRLDA
ncbi:oxidoreductase-like domain-containing protein [Ramlibacter sp. MAHUQ-53]|uniref:oxidoreductase-like domain-containing protein n=1 Tax=unclassified Ramlibacter TaxID=2617605 RepID=UPI003631A6C9